MSLPFLPTYAISPQNGGTKKQTLKFCNGYAIPVPSRPSKLEQEQAQTLVWDPELTFTTSKSVAVVGENNERTLVPASGHDSLESKSIPPQKILSFEGYFREPFGDEKGTTRIRKCVVNFFVEDETILVKEPKTVNSGLVQGVLIKRQKIPKNESYYNLEDFNIGNDLAFFGKKIRLVNCDFFTQQYLLKNGIEVRTPETIPEDESVKPTTPLSSPERTSNKGQLKKFLQNDGKVLRFSCYWDNRDKLFGELKPFQLHYYLVDDTVEVREVQNLNGSQPFSVFLRRQKLPNSKNKEENLTDKDFRVGQTVNIFGRQFFIYDCDYNTKKFYLDKFGWDIVPVRVPALQQQQRVPQKPSPNTQLKEPKKNFQQMLDNDTKILRFAATLQATKPEDVERIFVVSYYLADDTIGIYEPPQRNSGIVGGKFLERRKVLKPNSQQYYEAADFYVGAIIEVFCHEFTLHDADEYAFNYMESHPQQFPMSNIDLVHQKLIASSSSPSQLLQLFQSIDTNNNEFIEIEEFRDALLQFGFQLTEQEIITLIRKYDTNGDGHISYKEFASALQHK